MRKLSTIILVITVCMAMIIPAYAGESHPARLVDDADLLSQEDEETIVQRLDEISNRQSFDVVIVTTDSLDGKAAEAFADDYYDYNGYGMGEDDDGILFVISMGERVWAISTHAFGIEAFTDAGQKQITNAVIPYISDGNYQEGFDKFATLCDDFVTRAKANALEEDNSANNNLDNSADAHVDANSGDGESLEKNLSPISSLILAAMASGWLNTHGKKKSINMHIRDDAADYGHDFKLIEEKDVYLHTHKKVVTLRDDDEEDSDDHHEESTVHKSSSKRTHGGSTGSF